MTSGAYSGHDHLDIWRWKLDEPGYVYVIRAAFDTAIKVGFARNVPTRIAELQTGNPRPLNLLYVLPGDRRLERGLHLCLQGVRRVGEWFDGPKVDPFLEAVRQLADRMVEACDQTRQVPDVYELAKDLLPALVRPDPPLQPKPKKRAPVEVSQVEPTSISMEEKQRRLKAHYARPARDDHAI